MTARQLLLHLAVVTLALLVFASVADPSGSANVALAVSATVAGIVALLWSPRAFALVLALSLFVLPGCGADVLPVTWTLWLLLAILRYWRLLRRPFPELWGLQFIALAAIVSAVETFYVRFDAGIAASIFWLNGPAALAQFFASSADLWLGVLQRLLDYLLLVPLCGVFYALGHERQVREWFIRGLLIGSIYAAIILSLQVLEVPLGGYTRRSSFWLAVGRYSGSLSDPNAFGVMAALVVGVVASLRSSSWRYVALFLLVAASVFSGSRTLWIGYLIWLAFALRDLGGFAALKSRIRLLPLAGIVAVALALVVVQPPSLQRLVQTLQPPRMAEMFESRVLYSQLALEVWRSRPLVGVGLERFWGLQDDAAQILDRDLRGWRDNANNFYLQVLAEQGLLGLALVLLGFGALWWQLSRTGSAEDVLAKAMRRALVIATVLLVTGPHIFFSEWRFLLAAFVGLAAPQLSPLPRATVFRATAYALAAASLVLTVFWPQSTSSRGFYRPERGEHGKYAWTGSEKASVELCGVGKQLHLKLKAARPDVAQHPLLVTLRLEGQQRPLRRFKLKNSRWKNLRMRLGQDGEQIAVEVQVDRLWSPYNRSTHSDPRVFGVMLSWPKKVCSPLTR